MILHLTPERKKVYPQQRRMKMQYKLAKQAGYRLKLLRLKMNLTQIELAELLKYEERTIRRYETNGINSLKTLEYISFVLGVDLLTTFLS